MQIKMLKLKQEYLIFGKVSKFETNVNLSKLYYLKVSSDI